MDYSRLNADSELALPLEAEKSSASLNRWMSSFRSNPVGFVWRFTCYFMFFTGALMMVTALRSAPSDKYCAAQLSIWCKCDELLFFSFSSKFPTALQIWAVTDESTSSSIGSCRV